MIEETCSLHSGVQVDIKNLKCSTLNCQNRLDKLDDRMDSIIIRLNVLLSGVIVAVIALVLDLVVKSV